MNEAGFMGRTTRSGFRVWIGQIENLESGFGLLESLSGLLVFVILVLVGTKAYHNVVANHREANQVKALTDAVADISEKLGTMSVSSLTQAGSSYLEWSQPRPVGAGFEYFRYRVVPKPTVSGISDTTVAGLELETGKLSGRVLVPTRSFATLISPHFSSRNSKGEVSTELERKAEADFHASLVRSISDLTGSVVLENQARLNSFNCYDPKQCCAFMGAFFADPTLRAEDGLGEKCLYRCALAGNVRMSEWRSGCGTDFCSLSSWKTSADCCASILAGTCPSGSACANACLDCVGEDGSGCLTTDCSDYHFQQFVDCGNGSFCDGSPLPDGITPGYGDIKAKCRQPGCASSTGDCGERMPTCCDEYWNYTARGEAIEDPKAALCAVISRKEECCKWDVKIGWWEFACNTDGTVRAAKYGGNNTWYCGDFTTPGWDGFCASNKGCPSTFQPPGAPAGGCGNWNGPRLEDPWEDPYTGRLPPGATMIPISGGGGSGTPLIEAGGKSRTPSTRDGGGSGLAGGRE